MNVAPEDVLSYWLGDGDRNDPALAKARTAIWWGHDDATDREIRARFGDALAQAAAGELEPWAVTPHGRLALVILCDQFSRNAYRGTPQMYALDPLAQSHVIAALDRSEHSILAFFERVFLYMPLEHAEDREAQARCVQLFEGLRDAAPAELRPVADQYVDFANRHRAIVDRFGRFPHRNAILGRNATPEELEFLTQPGSSF